MSAPAAPGPRRRPLGRGRCPARALAPALGLVAARAGRVPRCSTGAWPGCALRTRVWSGWLAGLGCYAIGLAWARAFNWYGAVVLVLVEALFFAAAAAATPPRRGRALAFVGACTLAEAVRMTWPFGGLPLGGVFLGQAGGPLVELARLGGPLLITAGVWAGGVARRHARRRGSWARRRRVGGPSARRARPSSPPASSRWPSSARSRPTAARPSGRCGSRWSRGAGSGA